MSGDFLCRSPLNTLEQALLLIPELPVSASVACQLALDIPVCSCMLLLHARPSHSPAILCEFWGSKLQFPHLFSPLYSLSHVHRSPPAFLFLFCEIVSYYIVLADLEPVMILLPLAPKR